MRPGFLNGTDYWFGDIYQPTPAPQSWRRSSSRSSDVHTYPAPQTKLDWQDQFWVEDPVWEDYQVD
mgnify:CR=1|jgi:hypothetical protein